MRVRFTVPAQRDLQHIYEYLGAQNPVEASRLVARLIERARLIGSSPHEGRPTDEPNARVVTVPRLRYFIFYEVEKSDVHITHIRHTSRRRPPGWRRE